MEEYEKQIIKGAFDRCFGLQDSIKRMAAKEDELLISLALNSLVTNSGMRFSFLRDNLEEIIAL